jgi:hypothetical protein
MSEDFWGREEQAPARLPRVEDLPAADQGYDRDAVREAFDAFYRHAAQLDATLRVLESVEAFGKQARDLRADIRALRVASWGPLPTPRPLWASGYRGTSARAGGGGAVPAALPRLALEAAFIIAVAGGAAIAELDVALIVALVVAAWAIVAVAEFVASSRRATLRPGLLPAPARAESESPEPVREIAPAQETMIEAMPEPEPVVEPVYEAQAVPAEAEAAEEPEPEPEPEQRRRRFWRRREAEQEPEPEPEPASIFEPRHVRVLPATPVMEPGSPVDPWEGEAPEPASEPPGAEAEQELPTSEPPAAEAERESESEGEHELEPVAPTGRRRFWRRHRDQQPADQADTAPPEPEVVLEELTPPPDPPPAALPRDDAVFGAEPKPADTWAQAPTYTGVALDQTSEPDSEPHDETGEDEPLRVASVAPERPRDGRLRRGRR